MQIGIIGARIIGSTLGKKWAEKGHQIRYGIRNLENPEVENLVKTIGDSASYGNIQECIEFGEVIVLALPGSAVEEVIEQYAGSLKGKIIIDAANNLGAPVKNGHRIVREKVGDSHYYRAFNSLGWENYENPKFHGITADLFFCGNTGNDLTKVEILIMDIGLHPVHIGGLEFIDIVDSIGGLWFALVFGKHMGRRLAFKVLTD